MYIWERVKLSVMKKLFISAFALFVLIPINSQEKIELNNTGIENLEHELTLN